MFFRPHGNTPRWIDQSSNGGKPQVKNLQPQPPGSDKVPLPIDKMRGAKALYEQRKKKKAKK